MIDDLYDDYMGGADPEEEEDEEPQDDEPIEETGAEYTSAYNLPIIVRTGADRMSSHVLTVFEMTEIINIRSRQISTQGGAQVQTDDDNSVQIAKRELMARKCPLMVKRLMGIQVINGKAYEVYDLWEPNKMTFLRQYPLD